MPALNSVETLSQVQPRDESGTVFAIFEPYDTQRLEGAERVTPALPPVKLPLGLDGRPIREMVRIREKYTPERYKPGDQEFASER